MPVDQVPSRVGARSRDDAKIVQYHEFIDEKIDSTRRMVKVVDLATALVELLVSVLLFLLLVIVAEHWLVPGGLPSAVRVVLFLVLAAGCGYFAIRRLWPLCVRAINPVYAAQTIEHSSPALKNGLINLLLFRERRAEISDAVYRTLEEHAAHGLTRVPVDTAVDRTELIHLGYVLIGIVTVAGLYKVLSPKDPFVAAERVLMPWSNILPASRVTISDVKPGTETISQGEAVEVSAEVHGLNDDDTVVVRYSTEDGQIVGRAIPLKASADKLRFQSKLADGAERALGGGVTRNLKYHLEAGDARSLTYSITVVPAATILVERVDYRYPKYTGLVDQSVDGVGDIRAIEGTRVTIHARANGSIREANVDFDADGRPDLQMAAEEAKAHAEFELGLRDDRQTPLHASYMLRFANAEGRANHDPVKYSINVEPDKQPEAAIQLPQEKSRDARLDEMVHVEIEARDPDFALSAVRLRGEVSGRDVLRESLLNEEHHGPFNGKLALVPAARGLKEGDVLEYWAEVDDNRTPKPNTVATEHKTLRIVAGNPAQQPPQDRIARNERQKPHDGGQGEKNQQQKGEQNQKDQQGQQGKSADQQSGGQSGKGEQNQDGQGKGQGDKQQGDKSQPGQPGQSSGDQQSGGRDQNKQSNGLKQNQTGSGGGDKANQHDGQGQGGQEGGQSVSNDPSSDKPDQQGQNKQTGAGAAGGESSKDGAQSDGARPDAGQQENSSGGQSKSGDQKDGQQQNGEQQRGQQQNGQQQKGQKADSKSGQSQSPVSSEGDNDAEAFNRIQKRMEQSGELKSGENSKKDASQDDQGKQGENQKAGKENPSEGHQGQSGENKGVERNGESQPKEGSASKNSDSQQQGDSSKSGDKRSGAQSRKDDLNQQGKQGGESQPKQSSGSEQSSAKGSARGGNDGKKEGSPNSQPGMKPTEKPDQAGSKGEKKGDQEPPSGANSKKESDSHGDQGGDKAGGGAEGGGQKSPHDGTGSSGENQSADTGNGKSGEQGKGDTSSAGGKDAKSDHPTGSSEGKTQGKGSEQRDGVGEKAGGQKGDQQGAGGNKSKQDAGGKSDGGLKQSQGEKQGQTQDASKAENKQSDQQAGKNGEDRSGDSSDQKSDQQQSGKDDGSNSRSGSGGSGEPGGAVNPQVSITGEAPEGDAANLEYARKQTDLVVNKLADQLNRKRVDKDLLKELGWSEAELKRFVDRWQQRKTAAEQGNEAGEAAKRELDDALRSLGLRPGELQQSATQKDSMRDLHEGYRGPVPAEYKDRLRAYNQGVSRARRDGE